MFTRRQMMGAAAALSFLASTGAGVAQDLYIPLISKGFQHQFWQAVKTGADKAGQEMGVRVSFDGPDNETQVDKQIDMLAAALANKPAAIGIAALDSQAVIPLLKKAQADGIPVIAFDSGVESDIPLATASTDNKAAAALAADKLGEMIGGKGKVAVVAHNQTSLTGIDRRDGFLDQMKSKYPEVEVVAVEYGDGDHLKSTEITKAILAANADIKGIFGTNEGSAIGGLNGVREMGSKTVVVGFDSGKAQKDAIRSGEMAGAVTQNPVGIGYETVKAAVAATKGETLPKTIDTGFYWYDKTNIDDPQIAAVLYD